MEVTHTNKIDGEKLKQAREQRRWAAEEAARHFGVSKQAYYRWEKSEVRPHSRHLALLCKTFQLTPEELILPVEKRETSESANHETAYISGVASDASGSSVQTHPKWNLPTFFTSFIGRERELVDLCTLLTQDYVRLVTLLGPGGIGKTRLSLQVATKMSDDFVDGICFVSLDSVDTSDLMPTLAQALGIQEQREYGHPPLVEQVRLFLRKKQLLLVLDSFEKVEKAAPDIEELLAFCPDLKILATSRNKLNLEAEYDFPLLPLALPNLKDPIDLDVLVQCASVRLFSHRAKAILHDFAVTSENAQTIAKICVRLDGLPLAIELAAAGIELFSPDALFDQLSDSSQILKSHLGKTPPRQRTLYNTVKWSYDRLNEQEQWLFRSLSIFSGGFTLKDVGAFYEMLDPTLHIDAMDIKLLLSKSLIQRSGKKDRFTMLETIREYGLVFLQEHGEMEACRRAHTMYYLSLMEEADLKGERQKQWLARLLQEKENASAALAWLFKIEDVKLLLRFSEAWGKVLGLNGEWRKAREILKKVLDLPMSSELLAERAKVLRRVGYLAYRRRDLKDARELLQESADISRELGRKHTLAGALNHLGWVHYRQKDVASASRVLKECVVAARESKDKWAIANSLDSLGRWMHIQGQTVEARQMLSESAVLSREIGDKESLIRILSTLVSIEIALENITQADLCSQECTLLAQQLDTKPLKGLALDGVAEIALFQGDYEKAVSYYKERIRLAQELEDRTTVALKQLLITEITLMQGFSEQLIAPIEESRKFFEAQGDTPNIAAALDVLGSVRVEQGEFEQAWRLYEEALHLDEEIVNKRGVGKHLFGLAKVALHQKRADKAARLLVQVGQYLNPHADMHPAQRFDYEQAVEWARIQLVSQLSTICLLGNGLLRLTQGITNSYTVDQPGEEAFAKIQSELV